MKLFSKFGKSEDVKAAEERALLTPVPGHGNVHGLNLNRRRGFVKDAVTGESLFFNSSACSDFDGLSDGLPVNFKKEIDPADRMRVHAIDVEAV